jgi:hypothetical protein
LAWDARRGSFREAKVKLLVALLLLLAGCTSSYMRDAEPAGPPGPDEAKVVFYRTSAVSSVVAFPVYDGERLVGFTEKGNYFEVRCIPGRHVFSSGRPSFAASTLNADLAPGRTYSVKSYPKNAGAGMVVCGLVGAFAPVTRESNEWDRIERKRMEGKVSAARVDIPRRPRSSGPIVGPQRPFGAADEGRGA